MAHSCKILDHVSFHPDGQEERIKKPVSAYGSILLEELVDIMSITEHLIANSIRIHIREIRIFGQQYSSGNNYFELGIRPLSRCHRNQ